jgi:serine/threonine protein kinase
MKLAETDLNKIIKNNRGPMSFRGFFPVFKDGILGLTYMHIHNIAHRDIKPANMMKIS